MKWVVSVFVSAAVLLAADGAWAACKSKGKNPEVFVKPRTPLHRGPGLNYPVVNFIGKGKCMVFGELSFDQNWVLVKTRKIFGWVPKAQLSTASQKLLASLKPPTKGPAGGVPSRGFVETNVATYLQKSPERTAERVKELPKGAKLLALSVTKDERWVEVRDERSETGWVDKSDVVDTSGTLASLPRTGKGGLDAPVTEDPKTTQLADGGQGKEPDGGSGGTEQKEGKGETDPEGKFVGDAGSGGPKWTGLRIGGEVLAQAAMPNQSLDSNGELAFRRYDISAVAPGARVGLSIENLGPARARLGYSFAYLTGLAPEGQDALAINGQQHELRLVFGLPLEFEGGRFIPELGYGYINYDLDTALPGAETGQFISSKTQAATLGGSLGYNLSSSTILDLEAGALFGITEEYPFDLGDAGLSAGIIGAIGVRFLLSDSVDLVARWDARYRSTGFSGQSLLDPTITEATLSDFVHSISAGVGFTL